MNEANLQDKVALITGGAKRIGAEIARSLHALGMKLVLSYRHSNEEAHTLQHELHTQRPDSVLLVQADLLNSQKLASLVNITLSHWQRLDVLVNNAAAFYPTPLGQVSEAEWTNLVDSNLKAPFFLAQAAAPHLAATQGCIVNIVDIYGERPLKNHAVYSISKAGLIMATKALARELGPKVRVNGVAPGAILWPENDGDELARQRIISAAALKRQGKPSDIAKAVIFLIQDATYTTGHIITVDGGRVLSL